MKIAAIMGSPHGMKGSTGVLLGEVVRSAEQAGAVVTTLALSDYPVQPCIACDACHKTGVCPTRDRYREVRNALVNADGIVLASPNYMSSVTAQMKALMDRCCGLMHCQALEGKHAAAVVTTGGGGEDVQQYLLRFLRAMGCWTVGSVGAQAAQLAGEPGRGRWLQAAEQLGRRLVESIGRKQTFPEQAAERAGSFQRMKQLVTARKADWPYEYEHWKSRGWLESL